MRKKRTGISPVGIVLIVLLVVAIFGVGIAALSNQQAYVREARITPTPSITPRTVLITENPAFPTSTPTPLVLQMNSVGIEVKQLQMRLQELGYYSGEVDGQFGGGTRTAVEAFQRQHGITADGIAGESTLALLYNTAAQTFVREYDEFLRLATAENIDYAGLLAYCADKTLQSAMQDYLRNCEIKEHCGVKELETLKGLGNSQAETMLKLYAEKEYEAYKAKNTVDLVSLKVLADYGCADACAEYALRRYEDVTNGVYTKTEQEEMKKEIFDFFINGKSSANEIYKTSCFIMSLELKYQLGRYNGSYDSRLEEYKGDLSALREIKLGAEYKDVFGLDFENIVKELIEYIIKKIDEKEHPTPAAINYLDTGESISKRAQEIYNKMIGVSDDTSSKSNDDSLEYFAWKHMMDQSNTPWD